MQSVRTYMEIKKKNLSVQVLDGMMCHNGERLEECYCPVNKTKESFLKDNLNCVLYKTNTPDLFVNKISKNDEEIFYMSTTWAENSNKKSINDIELELLKQDI